MELTVSKRTAGKKTEIKKIRREGNIPAILYFQGKKGEEIYIDGIAFKKVLNTVERGTLSSKIFTLHVDGKIVKAIVKDIQYNITTYDVIHLDFERLEDNSPVTLNIPLKLTGTVDCVGVKLGGNLRQVVRSVKVTCLPKDIPTDFSLDVRNLNVGQSLSMQDIVVPARVKLKYVDMNRAAVTVAR